MWRAKRSFRRHASASTKATVIFSRTIALARTHKHSLPRGTSLPTSPQSTSTTRLCAGAETFTSLWHDKGSQKAKRDKRVFSTMAESKSWWKGSSRPAESQPAMSSSFESKPLNVPEETEAEIEQLPTRRVHLLGLGSIGTLVAHSLQCLPNPPPITLLMHRPELYESFKSRGRIIRLLNPNTSVNDEQFGYDVDVLSIYKETDQPYWKHFPNLEGGKRGLPTNTLQPEEIMESAEVLIYTLIVSVKAPWTIRALRSLKHRVNAQTTICLMQNGMGQIDELNREVFTDPDTRPTYMLGIISHGAYMSGPFAVVHAGFGTTALGIYRDADKYPLPPKSSTSDANELSEQDRKRMYPTDEDLYSNLSSRYLLRTLTRSPVLTCTPFPYLDIFQLQLEKLAMNSVLNPLTALLNVPNGSMLESMPVTRVQRLLLAETSLVIRGLPELEGAPGVTMRFSAQRLETLFNSVATKTAKNSSSMREDIRNLKPTEIEYINGYIVRRGEEQGIKCVLNYMITKLIEAKTLATVDGDVRPYGTTSIKTQNTLSGPNPSSSITLEDRGTQLKGKPY